MWGYNHLRLILFACFFFLAATTTIPKQCTGADSESTYLKIGIYDNPPKLFIDENNQPKGIFPGIVNAISQKEGWKIKYIPLSFKEGLKQLENGGIDIMQDVAWSEKRSRTYGFTSETVMVSWGRVYKKKGRSISTLIDLKDKRIAYMDGGIYSDGPDGLKTLMKKFELGAVFVPANGYKQVFEYIEQGKADAGVVNRLYGKTNKHKYNIENTPILISPISIRLAFSKSNPATSQLIKIIDAQLARLKADDNSIYYQLIDEYIGEPRRIIPPFFKTLLIFLLVLIAGFAILGIFLNRQSQKKSVQLQNRDLELKVSEKKFRTIFENLQDVYFDADLSGILLTLTPSAEKILGFPVDELIGLNLKKIFHQVEDYDAFTEMLLEKFSIRDFQVLCTKKNYGPQWVSIHADLYTDEAGIQGIRGILRNITQQKNSETKIEKLQKEAIRNQKLESTGILAGGIAHDFNNILLGLFGNISLAKGELSVEDNAYKLIEEAEKSMSRAKDLTTQLLTFAKGGDPIKQAVTIDQAIKETAAFNLAGSNIKITMERPEDLWLVSADKGQISQAISNLVINSRQAMPEGGTLKIKLENAALSENNFSTLRLDQYVKISITDEGSGIPEMHLEKVFDPYFTTKKDGSGLGLAIVHSIILKHHGYIYVNSIQGEGTTFVIYLPIADSNAPTLRTEKPTSQTSMGTQSLNILLMDDDSLVKEVSQKILNKLGHSVELCDEGSQTLKTYQSAMEENTPYHIVIMDLTIPGGMGGQEAVVKLLGIDPQATAVVASGYSTDPVMANYKEYGFKAMITKPYTVEKMEQVIEQAFHS